MTARRLVIAAVAVLFILTWWLSRRADQAAAAQQNFDQLSDQDRQTLFKRFESAIWPLLKKDGKKGCVGCHTGNIVSALKFSGDARKDFQFLLKEGFFLYDDEGSLLARVTDKSKTRRMPKDAPAWGDMDIQTLRAFTLEVHKRQQKK